MEMEQIKQMFASESEILNLLAYISYSDGIKTSQGDKFFKSTDHML